MEDYDGHHNKRKINAFRNDQQINFYIEIEYVCIAHYLPSHD